MRNLRLLYHKKVDKCAGTAGYKYFSIDCDTQDVYAASKTDIMKLCPESQQVVSLPQDGLNEIVGIEYLPDQSAVCAATREGDVNLCTTFSSSVECVGTVESGLLAMAWSPDKELIVLLTGQNTIILMTREFDPVLEFNMYPDEFGEAKLVSVGWGKKETQFHGSEGKHAATVKKTDKGKTLEWDDNQPRITWRGDGLFFAVTAVNPSTECREVRVWTREGALHSTCEAVDGLEQGLAWKPSGSLIVSSQMKPNKHDVIFYEKNGLRHGEFTLPFAVNSVKIKEMRWNIDSTILAIWGEDHGSNSSKSYVLLYTMGNYHWYLKQKLEFSVKDNQAVTCMEWDPEHAKRLHIMLSSGAYLQYNWTWCINGNTVQQTSDDTLVAVIDGDKTLMTPFNTMIVPPPYCAYHIQLADQVSDVIFGQTKDGRCTVAMLLSNGKFAIYFYNSTEEKGASETVIANAGGNASFNMCCSLPSLHGIYTFTEDITKTYYPLKICHLTWISSDLIVFVTLDGSGLKNVLHVACLDEQSKQIRINHSLPTEDFIIAIMVGVESKRVVLQCSDGKLLEYLPENETLVPFTFENVSVKFPIVCSHFAVCMIGAQEVAIGLTERFRLYVNNIEIANNCTSFAIHKEFLLLSTHAHTLRCISRSTDVNVLPTLSDGKAHPFDESVRRVERGARIVCVDAVSTKVVLQMPRGNLETIHPRALILSTVRVYLDRLEYSAAFTLMKKHRINMNLIHDHSNATFLENINLFIQQIGNVSDINLFLTALQCEDVTVTMYTAAYIGRESAADVQQGKVDKVCNAMIDCLQSIDPEKYLLCILTAHTRKTNPELELALQKINNLRKNNKQAREAEEALKYFLFLVDVNELYDVALGTYDFDLVMMVAEKSQKDPKEYLQFLNDLRRLDQNYKCYKIDLHLRRYPKALEHIVKCGKEHFDECVGLVTSQKLYQNALKLYPVNSEEYKTVAEVHGTYLSEKACNEEAGLAFLKAHQLDQALSAFQKCLNWRQAVCVASRLNYSQTQIVEMANSLADQLKEQKRHMEAACLLEQYANDVEDAIVTLIDGHHWEEALRLMYKYHRTDFIETNFITSMLENHENTMTWLNETVLAFERYKARLVIVRQEKERKLLEALEGGFHDGADADLYSDASSATGESVRSSVYSSTSSKSNMSKSSGRSRKSSRKTERKKWSLKEGSAKEDLALVEALANLIRGAEDTKKEVNGFLRMLVLFHHEEKATDLQDKLDNLCTLMQRAIPEIWNIPQEAETSIKLGPGMTANSIALAMQQRGNAVDSTNSALDPVLFKAPSISQDTQWKLHSSITALPSQS